MTEARRARLGRLSAEFVVIVVGVLVALAVDASWEARQERAREEGYLRQLVSDLESIDATAVAAIGYDESTREAARALGDALQAPTLPPSDSLTSLLATAFVASPFTPVLGTLDALVETGDIRLIRDDDLRNQLLEYRASVSFAAQTASSYGQTHIRAAERLGRTVNLQLVRNPESPARRAALDWEAISSETAVHSDVYTIFLAANVRLQQLRRVRSRTADLVEELRRHVE